MKVLIVGQPGYFVRPLIRRLHSENVDVYLLHERRQPNWKSGREVHEEYLFPLDSQSVSYVVQDVKPDCIVVAGAADSGFPWENPSDAGVRVTAALSNVLLCARESGTRRVFFVSNEEVFDCDGMQEHAEVLNVPVRSRKGFALAQCESLCLSSAVPGRLDTYVLRASSIYGEPVFKDEDCGRVSRVISRCMDDAAGQKLDSKKGYYPTHASDVVEVLFRMMKSPALESGIYQVSGNELVSDAGIAAMVKKEEAPQKPVRAITLTTDKICGITDFRPKHTLASSIIRIGDTIRKFNEAEPQKKKKNSMGTQIWKLLRPAVETVVFFLLIALLGLVTRYLPGFETLDLMLIFVLIVAVTFGKPATVIAVLLATGHFIWYQTSSGREISGVLLSMPTVCRMLNLFITGMITAHCRDRLKWERDDMADEKSQLLFELDTAKAMNDSNVRIKRHLEEQIVNMDDSLGKIYSIVRGLDDVEPNQVVYNAVEIIKKIMHARCVAIYTVSNAWYARQIAYSGDEECSLDKSLILERYPDMMEMLNQGQVFVNTAMLSDLPLMVAPIMQDGRLKTMLMVWNVEFTRLTPYHINLMMVLSNMISGSLNRAETYADAIRDQRYISGTDILNRECFRKTLEMASDAVRHNLTSWVALELEPSRMEIQKVSAVLSNMLRSNDIIGQNEDGKIWVLLANSDRAGAEIVLGRMEKSDISGHIVEMIK